MSSQYAVISGNTIVFEQDNELKYYTIGTGTVASTGITCGTMETITGYGPPRDHLVAKHFSVNNNIIVFGVEESNFHSSKSICMTCMVRVASV